MGVEEDYRKFQDIWVIISLVLVTFLIATVSLQIFPDNNIMIVLT